MLAGRFFNGTELQYRKNVVGARQHRRIKLLFEPSGTDPIGKTVRVGTERFEVVGVFDKRPAAGGFNLGQDDFVVIPYTAYQRVFGLRAVRVDAHRDDPPDPDRAGAARGRQPGGRDGRRRARHADPARAEARRAERLRPADAGRRSSSCGIRSARARSWR